jgi:hypothetical protein
LTPDEKRNEQMREDLDTAAIALVACGFRAIDAGFQLLDELTAHGKQELKKAIIRGLSAKQTTKGKT